MAVAYYVSGHGFGHATRALPVLYKLKELLGPNESFRFFLCSPHPSFLFENESLFMNDSRFIVRPLATSLDGVQQVDAVTLDKQKTKERLRLMMENGEKWIEQESAWCLTEQISLILSDAAFLPMKVAQSLNIPGILVSNFLWDSIYAHMFQEDDDDTQKLIHHVSNCYKNATIWLRMPGHIESPAFNPNFGPTPPILDIPAVVRSPTQPPSETLQHLAPLLHPPLSHDDLKKSTILLVMFGGHTLSPSFFSSPSLLPSLSWRAIFIGIPPSSFPDMVPKLPTYVHLLDATTKCPLSVPDIVATASVCLGKLGYGTCGECLSSRTPMVVVRRAGFVEEEGLKRWMGSVVEMPKGDFEQGRWEKWVRDGYALRNEMSECLELNGGETVAEYVLQQLRQT